MSTSNLEVKRALTQKVLVDRYITLLEEDAGIKRNPDIEAFIIICFLLTDVDRVVVNARTLSNPSNRETDDVKWLISQFESIADKVLDDDNDIVELTDLRPVFKQLYETGYVFLSAENRQRFESDDPTVVFWISLMEANERLNRIVSIQRSTSDSKPLAMLPIVTTQQIPEILKTITHELEIARPSVQAPAASVMAPLAKPSALAAPSALVSPRIVLSADEQMQEYRRKAAERAAAARQAQVLHQPQPAPAQPPASVQQTVKSPAQLIHAPPSVPVRILPVPQMMPPSALASVSASVPIGMPLPSPESRVQIERVNATISQQLAGLGIENPPIVSLPKSSAPIVAPMHSPASSSAVGGVPDADPAKPAKKPKSKAVPEPKDQSDKILPEETELIKSLPEGYVTFYISPSIANRKSGKYATIKEYADGRFVQYLDGSDKARKSQEDLDLFYDSIRALKDRKTILNVTANRIATYIHSEKYPSDANDSANVFPMYVVVGKDFNGRAKVRGKFVVALWRYDPPYNPAIVKANVDQFHRKVNSVVQRVQQAYRRAGYIFDIVEVRSDDVRWKHVVVKDKADKSKDKSVLVYALIQMPMQSFEMQSEAIRVYMFDAPDSDIRVRPPPSDKRKGALPPPAMSSSSSSAAAAAAAAAIENDEDAIVVPQVEESSPQVSVKRERPVGGIESAAKRAKSVEVVVLSDSDDDSDEDEVEYRGNVSKTDVPNAAIEEDDDYVS